MEKRECREGSRVLLRGFPASLFNPDGRWGHLHAIICFFAPVWFFSRQFTRHPAAHSLQQEIYLICLLPAALFWSPGLLPEVLLVESWKDSLSQSKFTGAAWSKGNSVSSVSWKSERVAYSTAVTSLPCYLPPILCLPLAKKWQV